MRYVIVERTDVGFDTDTRSYLSWLAGHAHELPPGARAVALDPVHNDFTEEWCPRSATFDHLSTRYTDSGVDATLVLAGLGASPFEFVLRYSGVSHLEVDGDHGTRPRSGLLADEILPHADGVSHELALSEGSITVVARDFTARWSRRPEPGPERTVYGLRSDTDLSALGGRALTQVGVGADHVLLSFAGHPECSISLQGDYAVSPAGGGLVTFSDARAGGSALVPLLGRSVESATVHAGGVRLLFEDRSVVDVLDSSTETGHEVRLGTLLIVV